MRFIDSNDPTDIAEVGGTGETVAFSISASADMINRMISDIYADGPKTVSRELIANALDAQAMGGERDAQIIVHIPTKLDPTFRVRDYGVGMTHAFVMKLYTSFGHSEKKDTNDATGMFGIGSKSPLSITDTFTVRAFDKPGFNGDEPHIVGGVDMNKTGRVRMYTVYRNEHRVPVLSHTFDVKPRPEDEVERGGVLVEVPISDSWYTSFMEGIASQHFIWFDKNIKFDGSTEIVKDKFYESITRAADNFYFAPSRDRSGDWSVYIRQGAAIYDLNQSEIGRHLPSDVTKFIRDFCDGGRHIMFDVPIGTINVTSAREKMRYSHEGFERLSELVKASVEDFRQKLVASVGTAHNYRLAINNIAASFLPKEEQNTLFGLKSVVPLARLVSKKVEENYSTHYDSLPDVPESQPRINDDGDTVRDADGRTVYDTVMVRPSRVPPTLQERVEQRAFPEGKVILHTGQMWFDGVEPYIKIESDVRTYLNVTHPNVFYIIPNHLQKWSDKIKAHVKVAFAKERLPRREAGSIPVYIVRCAKRNVDSVRAMLKARGLEYRVFTADDVPEIAAEPTEARIRSKTSVYRWVPGRDTWDEAKVEPDYSQPAYFVTRVGVTHEIFTHNPLKPPGTSPGTSHFTLRPRVSTYDMARSIRYANSFGDLDKSYPIYRVTDSQAEKIAKTCPEWKHLYTHLALSCEKRVRTSPASVIMQSQLAGNGNHYLRSLMRNAMNVTKYSTASERRVFDIVNTLRKADPLFMYVQAARYCLEDKTIAATLLPDVGKQRELMDYCSSLFGNAYTNFRKNDLELFNDLAAKHEAEYGFLGTILSNVSRADMVRHVNYYMVGFMQEVPQRLVKYAEVYPQIVPMVEVFNKKLDSVYAEVYGVPAELPTESPTNEVEQENENVAA